MVGNQFVDLMRFEGLIEMTKRKDSEYGRHMVKEEGNQIQEHEGLKSVPPLAAGEYVMR